MAEVSDVHLLTSRPLLLLGMTTDLKLESSQVFAVASDYDGDSG